tara:strand:+ start:424 stop:837 length:414 start_codon:yes stop_codon:yes gene_type:complete
MKKYLNHTLVALLTLTLTLTSGCSVFMAAKQPGKKDVSVFKVGNPRALILAEFGLPLVTEEKNGKKVEIFKFVQGYSAGTKAGRAVLHGTADVLTLGLWEVVGTPAEGTFTGNDMAYQVTYDEDERISEVVLLKAKD